MRSLLPAAFGYSVLTLMDLDDLGPFVHAQELAQRHGFPEPFLAKLLQTLARVGILESVRGARGGFRLAKPAHRIVLAEILAAIHEVRVADTAAPCVLTHEPCNAGCPCALHQPWSQARAGLDVILSGTTLRDLQLRAQKRQRLTHE